MTEEEDEEQELDLKQEVKGWARDILEVAAVLLFIIIFSQLFLGPDLLLPLVAVTSCSMYHPGSMWNGVGCVERANWDSYLVQHNFTKGEIQSFPFQNGFSMGDMIITVTPNGQGVLLPVFSPATVGDVIIYQRDNAHRGNSPIIHRIIGEIQLENYSVTKIKGTSDCLTRRDIEEDYVSLIRSCQRGERCQYPSFPEDGSFKLFLTKGDNNGHSDQCGSQTLALPITEDQLVAKAWLRLPYVGWLKILLNSIIPI